DLRWSVLEKLSRVTRFYKDASAQILEHPLGRPFVPYLPPLLVSHVQVPRGAQEVCNDYESARLYLARWAAAHMARNGNDSRGSGSNGSDPPLPASPALGRVWHEWITEHTECGEFEVLTSAQVPPLVRSDRPLAAEQWVDILHGPAGRLREDAVTIRRAIFAGGVDHDIRPLVWLFLLGVYPWDSDEAQRRRLDAQLTERYYDIKDQWLNRPVEHGTEEFKEQKSRIEKDVLRTDRNVPFFAPNDSTHGPREPGSVGASPPPGETASDTSASSSTGLPGTNANLEIMKDILMTYHYHNRELGYVQGMSDLLAPLFAVMQDEVQTFWCFEAFMARMEPNFRRDQAGMHNQLQTLRDLTRLMLPNFYTFLAEHDADNMFCCFRWLLIWFKREFAFLDILSLWEVLWCDYLTPHFHYFVALAILDEHADAISENLVACDEILKYINDLSGTIDVNSTLRRAEILFHRFRRQIEFLD
ncbi:rab-GTPase-TBC domain-containing protein, partial [Dimargaris cristalligena]